MKIIGCGKAHNSFWHSYGALNKFCGLCGEAISEAPLVPEALTVKIQIRHKMDYEIPVYRFHYNKGANEGFGEMWSNNQDYTTAANAANAAREHAESYFGNKYKLKWEVWLDEPVTTRENRRMTSWEK